MKNLVDTVIEDPRWEAVDVSVICEDAARRVLDHLGMTVSDYEMCVLACDDGRIAELNGQFREKDAPTNVLSWPTTDLAADKPGDKPHVTDAEPELGDIALAWDTCHREADALGIPLRDHLYHLIVHGTLHLLGYDHIRDKDAALMETLEVAILSEIGIADPYCLAEAPQPDNG